MTKIEVTSKLLMLLIFFTFASISTQAQESMSPPPEIQKLYELEGKWTGVYEITMEGKSFKSNSSYTWSKISDGWGMLIDEVSEMTGMPNYLGHNIIGYDLGEKKYHLYTISNYAQVHDHVGNWTDDKTMYLEYNGTVEGKPYKEKINMTIVSPEECVLDVKEITDGKETGSYKGTFHRVK